MKAVRLGKFLACLMKAAWELRWVFLLIVGFGALDVFVLVYVSGVEWQSATVSVAAWFVGSGTVAEGESLWRVCGFLLSGLLGYSLLGLIVWVMTVAARKAES
jgi:hypothetical protein